MSADVAARIRESPAVVVHDSGVENINRVVRTRRFGLVIDRRRKPRRRSALFSAPTFMPQPYFEHDMLRGLNAAGASFVQGIHYADDAGLILQYAEGQTPTVRQWAGDAELRGEYSRRFVDAMGELAAVSDAATPGVVRPEERGFWPARLESTAQYGRLMRDRTVLTWSRVLRGWTTEILGELGETGDVAAELAGFELTGNRPLMLLHNDLHPQNTVREPFRIIDWTNGSVGDPLWAASMIRRQFPTEAERDRLMAGLRAALPAEMFHGFERDWRQYEVLDRQRTRTVAAGLISEFAADALAAASRADGPQARRAAVRPYAERIHSWSRRFTGHPADRTAEETTDLVLEHIERQLDAPAVRPRRGAPRSRSPVGPVVVTGPPRATRTGQRRPIRGRVRRYRATPPLLRGPGTWIWASSARGSRPRG
ncbi:aminoglycoside phosphotransferase family protein [Yinghuangia sp. ASG 101]|uniref:phosphotransferase n=1 Tax=Yinghuangia sp. ASG 101 TaxID=2896848 RepID=UPI001E533672|nr:phosphotransferase [Yinghuangia sp. ASG 101]UGQ12145.1 aminoglycoside phosphotransferase family protein [Yinghuangia sp. ASG 101]